MKEKRCLFEHFLSAPEWERREGVGSDFNKILNLYSLLSNSCAPCLLPKVSIITLAKLRHRAVEQPAQSHITTGWNHGLEIKYIQIKLKSLCFNDCSKPPRLAEDIPSVFGGLGNGSIQFGLIQS